MKTNKSMKTTFIYDGYEVKHFTRLGAFLHFFMIVRSKAYQAHAVKILNLFRRKGSPLATKKEVKHFMKELRKCLTMQKISKRIVPFINLATGEVTCARNRLRAYHLFKKSMNECGYSVRFREVARLIEE